MNESGRLRRRYPRTQLFLTGGGGDGGGTNHGASVCEPLSSGHSHCPKWSTAATVLIDGLHRSDRDPTASSLVCLAPLHPFPRLR
uniref:Uncharacterized protein n=1 Tax=Plectus sambesii TaxID=2011161 RepID=A0A914VG70_9BILA